MNGIVFFKTIDLDRIRSFYRSEIGCSLWLEQPDCAILKHGNLLLGFCRRDQADKGGIITFFYNEKKAVDRIYEKLRTIALSSPKKNEKYGIYHFFAADPDGRQIEFQWFMDGVDAI